MIESLRKKITQNFKKTNSFKQLLDSLVYNRFPIYLEGIKGGLQAFLLAEISTIRQGEVLVVLPTQKEAQDLVEDLKMMGKFPLFLPELESMAYSRSSQQQIREGQRLSALGALSANNSIIVTTVRAFLQPVVPKSHFIDSMLYLRQGEAIDPLYIEKRLSSLGYLRVPRISCEGEFSLKGEVLDIFVPGEGLPFRIIFEWDEIEQIKTFDLDTFVSVRDLREVMIQPAKEAFWDEVRIDALLSTFNKRPVLRNDIPKIFPLLEEGLEIPNGHLFFHLSFDKPTYLTEYLNKSSLLFLWGMERLELQAEAMKKEWLELYASARREKIPSPHPDDIIASLNLLLDSCKKRVTHYDIRQPNRSEDCIKFDSTEPGSYFGNINFLKQEMANLESNGYGVFIFGDSKVQQSRIQHLLSGYNIEILPDSISEGFLLPKEKLAVINDREIFGRKRRTPVSVKRAKSRAIDTFIELEEGDYIVHINYGIGLFEAIERVKVGVNERDYIRIRFADDEKLFVPVEQLNLIQKYIGNEGSLPRLDRMGSKSWEARKKSAKKSVEELANHLLKIYAERRNARGFAFSKDTEWQIEFEASFPYEETADQLQCVEEIKQDMESHQPMDRLVCGDVGYGKTEVAMRAIFKAIVDGRQAALLAPTTILVEQHYENALERFKHFPVRIAMVSRFVSKSKIKETLLLLAKGEVDFIIGTHRLLSKDVTFQNLGLMVIDEEQRFGVKHKERLKEMKASIDCLALSATPIPRTLHMSLLKIRDISLLTTPPYNRKPIETYIREFDEEIISKAVKQEMERGGQLFFLHNRIETLEAMKIFLETLVPEALIRTAHGRMSAIELEDLMHSFTRGDFHILVATTIIENGIDISNVNTIIIDRADMYGISQLYQLRGRVGRSDRKSYAWLLYPENTSLSELAMKRLQVISDNTELGAGFKVAMKDLEVRGAGNLLGREQSGQIASVGYDLYVRMLENKVAEMEGHNKDFGDDIVMDLVYSGFIPNEYISDSSDKMIFYKRIATVQNELELDQVCSELNDRFGPMPPQVHSLLSLAEIRILCRKLHISQLREKGEILEVTFEKIHLINAEKVIRILQESNGLVRYNPSNPQVLQLQTKSIGLDEKSEFIRTYLSRLK